MISIQQIIRKISKFLGIYQPAKDKRYRKIRKEVEIYFSNENKIIDSATKFVSPSGLYELEICKYSTGPNTWTFSRGIVTRLSDQKIIADIKRNIGHFWHAWVEHQNGYEYLLCGEDYQGYSTINLTLEKNNIYFPEEGHSGLGFCWAAAHPSPDGLVLAVDGCYWAFPYDMVFYDFSNPEQLPLQEIDHYYNIGDPVTGWVNNDTFVFEHYYKKRKSDGKKYSELSEEEQDELDKNVAEKIGKGKEQIEWKRPMM